LHSKKEAHMNIFQWVSDIQTSSGSNGGIHVADLHLELKVLEVLDRVVKHGGFVRLQIAHQEKQHLGQVPAIGGKM
jgi:hypothetical protein